LAQGRDPECDRGRGLACRFPDQAARRDPGHLHPKVDPVAERSRDAPGIALGDASPATTDGLDPERAAAWASVKV
jgi:hypothetical protein